MSEEELAQLPPFSDALKLSKEEYYRFAEGFFKSRSYCQTFVVDLHEKLMEWCSALNCLKAIEDCKIPPYPQEAISATVLAVSTTAGYGRATVTSSYRDLMNAVLYNGSCYDDYYCNQRTVAPYLHCVLGLACLAMCLVGILSTLVFLPAFNVVSNRTGVTFYLTAMAIFDCIYMVLFTVIVVIQYIPAEFNEQLDMYTRFTAYLIPYGLPTMQLMELLSVWITVAILVDRFLYLKFGFHSKIICSRKVSAKILSAILILLIIYTIPKYLEYCLIEYPRSGIFKVMYTPVGFNESFQNMLLHWLKVPIEMFLPYLADAIFSVINSIKFYDLMYKRKLSEASKTMKKNGKVDARNDCEVDAIMHAELEKDAIKFPSLTINSNIPIITSSLKGAENKENAMVVISLILGFLLIALKMPKFVLHALKSEEYVDLKSTKFFQPVNDFLDLSLVLAKPIVYFCAAKHFRTALKSVFCCNEFDSEAIIKVCPAVQMTEMANEYIRNAAEFSSNSTHSNSADDRREQTKLLEDNDEGIVMRVKSDEETE